MAQTFKDDLLEGGVRHALYRDPKDSEIDYRVLGIQYNQKRQCFVVTTPFKRFTRKRRLIDCLDDERYFIKNPR